MRKVIFGGLVLFLLMVLAVGARAYTWTYNTNFDFDLTGFSVNGTPTNGPLTLTIDNITGLTLPDPPSGTYQWYLEIDNFFLDFVPGTTDDDISGSNLGPFNIGTWEAPLSSSGSYNLGNFDVPELPVDYDGDGTIDFTLGDYTVENALFSWEIYDDTNALADPGDTITKIILTLTADNLYDTINADLTLLDNILGGGNGIIDGTGTADFKVSAVPEPSTVLLLGAGGLIAFGISRKRNKK
ncbi:protein of unknown function DUF1555 [Thermodesulfatator indicus DSM 15286]|uniref:Ice-binding protein C-terminal domain-containing protein n=1 Tax=Thermodesulfatator indicus (strain DSM 15286 / JCM 11887 / CIR29812) TaxID=667014 RepID=F8ADK4_THEID|nr:PEP-CTERM sorting domain-containing protein [Thermodesulfatator indicus]AEH44878.1 protein of unknown function DUF1555 [Thermodesulfatator indicus DSM 15286]